MTNPLPSEDNTQDIPGWYWAVAGLALVWNLFGVIAFVIHMMVVGTPEMLAQLPEAERALFTELPRWLDYAFGAAVIGGALGCIALLLKNEFAIHLFVVSLAGVLIQNYYAMFETDALNVKGDSALYQVAAVIVIAIGLIVFSFKMKARGILK